ncbi:MAG: flippase, partial [Halieaceae bacterium]|nr:flippase [Halieaceae bacterium]
VRDEDSAGTLLGSALLLRLASGALGSLTCVAIAMSIADPATRQMLSLLALMALLGSGEVLAFWFEARVQSRPIIIVQLLAFACGATAKLCLVMWQAELALFALVFVLETLLVAAGSLRVFRRAFPAAMKLRVSTAVMRQLLRDSWPLLVSSLAIIIYTRADQVMLGQLASTAAVGQYSAAVSISEFWHLLIVAVSASVMPGIIRVHSENRQLFLDRIQLTLDVMTSVTAIVVLALSLLAPLVVALLFGSAYAEAGTVLAIHAWSSIFVVWGVIGSGWHLAEDRQQLSMQRTLLGAAANIALNLVLIPRYGAVGAAVATLAAMLLATLGFDVLRAETRLMLRMKLQSLHLPHLLAQYRALRSSSS